MRHDSQPLQVKLTTGNPDPIADVASECARRSCAYPTARPRTDVLLLAALALRPYPDDTGDDCVVLIWSGTREAAMGAPNDEALPGHRLYQRGLAELRWAGLVEDSERIAQLRHYILPLKEGVVEVIAETVSVQRRPGTPLHAASFALSPT